MGNKLSDVDKLEQVLFAMLGREDLVKKWWDSPNYHFKLSTPNEVWNASDDGKREVIEYVLGHASGSYS
jgi:hypothetical protein